VRSLPSLAHADGSIEETAATIRVVKRASTLLLVALAGPACGDVTPPWFVDTLIARDTSDPVGGYTISSVVRDDGEIDRVRISYRVGLPAAPIVRELRRGDTEDLWLGEIPGPLRETRVYYFLLAVDADGNAGRDPGLAPDMYSFAVSPVPRPAPALDGGVTDLSPTADAWPDDAI